MKITDELIADVKKTTESGYYERLAPARKEKKSICEFIEKMHAEGKMPIIAEIAMSWPKTGSLLPDRKTTGELIERLAKGGGLCALDVWVEPKWHGGDLRWLSREMEIPLIAKDWIIEPRQIVGGDAVVLDTALLQAANADSHELIEYSHEQDLEAVLVVYTGEQLAEAKNSEADVIMISNFGTNGTADISTTANMLSKNKTGRPVISAHGIRSPQDIRTILVSGADAVELSAQQVCAKGFEGELEILKKAINGKGPEAAQNNGK